MTYTRGKQQPGGRDAIVRAYHAAVNSNEAFVEVSLEEGTCQHTLKAAATQAQAWVPRQQHAMLAPAPCMAMTRPAADGSLLPTHNVDEPVGAAYAFWRYAARAARAVPKWIMRRTRPLLNRLSMRINSHKRVGALAMPGWLHQQATRVRQNTAHAVSRVQGVVKGSSSLTRFTRGMRSLLPTRSSTNTAIAGPEQV